MNLINILEAAVSNASTVSSLGLLKIGDNYDSLINAINLIQSEQTKTLDLNSVTNVSSELILTPNQYISFNTSSYCGVLNARKLGAPYWEPYNISYLSNGYLLIEDGNGTWIYKDNVYIAGNDTTENNVINASFPIIGTDSTDYVYIGALYNDSGTFKPVIYRMTVADNSLTEVSDEAATNIPGLADIPNKIVGIFDTANSKVRFLFIYQTKVEINAVAYDPTWSSPTWDSTTNSIVYQNDAGAIKSASFTDLDEYIILDREYIQRVNSNGVLMGTIDNNLIYNGEQIGNYIDIASYPSIEKIYTITDAHEVIVLDKASGEPLYSFGHFGKDMGNDDPSAMWGQNSITIKHDETYPTIFISDNRNYRIIWFLDTDLPDDQIITLSDVNFGVKTKIKKIVADGENISDENKHFVASFSDGTNTWEMVCGQEYSIYTDSIKDFTIKYKVDDMYVSNWKLKNVKIIYDLPMM